jgi:hypothetical protein
VSDTFFHRHKYLMQISVFNVQHYLALNNTRRRDKLCSAVFLAPLCNIKWRASTFCDFLHDGRARVERAGAWYKQQHSTNSPFSENTCIPQLAYNNGFINISCRQLSRERKIKSKSISIYIYTFTNISLLQQHFSLSFRCVLAYSRKRKKSTSAHHFTQDTQRQMHFTAQPAAATFCARSNWKQTFFRSEPSGIENAKL